MFELPIFPLDTVLFPGMPVRLHIFEQRYREMFEHVLSTNRIFGISLIKKGQEALGPLPEPYETGCTARVSGIEKLDDGTFNATVIGDERFRILRMGAGQSYLTAFVESAPLQEHHTLEVVRGAHRLRPRLVRYLALLAQFVREDDEGGLTMNVDLTGLQLPEDPMMLLYLAAALVQIPAIEKQPLLEADTAALLLSKVQQIFRRELALLPPLAEVSEEQARVSAWVN
jgi:Lon protease-like protein